MSILRAMLADDTGATLVEYALIISLIAIIVAAIAQSFGVALAGMYQKIATTLQSA